VFLVVAILTAVRWNLKMVLICIFFMARDGEHFFMCFLTIWSSSFEKAMFSSFAHFFIVSLNFWEFSFLSFLYFIAISPLSEVWLAKFFFYTVGSLFNLEIISFFVQKLFFFVNPFF
jgi:hypothetical protein